MVKQHHVPSILMDRKEKGIQKMILTTSLGGKPFGSCESLKNHVSKIRERN